MATVNIANGAAAFATSQLSAGAHSVTATYSGDAANSSCDVGDLSQTVNAPRRSPARWSIRF